jgi:hypothetical protein
MPSKHSFNPSFNPDIAALNQSGGTESSIVFVRVVDVAHKNDHHLQA